MTKDLSNTIQLTAKRITIYGKQYGLIGIKWLLKVFKSFRYAVQKRLSKRKFDKMLQQFGGEVYINLVKEGKTGWMETPSIKERIEMLKLIEANVNHFDRLREDLNRHFEMQKLEIKKNAEVSLKALPSQSSGEETP